jgi:hypothetical protein
MPLYPKALPRWDTKTNNIDVVEADHVNKIQDELEATQKTLGAGIDFTPQQARIWYPADGAKPPGSQYVFRSLTGGADDFQWGSVHERIINIERAALRDLDANYVSLFGGGLVDPGKASFPHPGTGGVGIVGNTTDPALAVFSRAPGGVWAASASASIWGDGSIFGKRLRLGLAEVTEGGFSFTNLVGTSAGELSNGTVRIRMDDASENAKALTLTPPKHAKGEGIYLNNAGAIGVRNVIRIADSNDATLFLLDSDGNITCKSINGDALDKDFTFDGLTLDKNGLVFHAGGEYRPGGLVLKGGGLFDGSQLTFVNNRRIYSRGQNLVVDAPLTEFEGGYTALGMHTYMYTVSGTMFIPVPPYSPSGHTAAAEGKYAAPQSRENGASAYTRKIHLPFEGPSTGAVEIFTSVEVRSFSRPTWVSYEIRDVTASSTGVIVLRADDAHSAMNNGARAQPEDIDQVRVTNFNVVSGLTPGRKYELRVLCRAADPGYTDRNFRWILANRYRALIRPLTTKLVVKEITT